MRKLMRPWDGVGDLWCMSHNAADINSISDQSLTGEITQTECHGHEVDEAHQNTETLWGKGKKNHFSVEKSSRKKDRESVECSSPSRPSWASLTTGREGCAERKMDWGTPPALPPTPPVWAREPIGPSTPWAVVRTRNALLESCWGIPPKSPAITTSKKRNEMNRRICVSKSFLILS